jgi:hypothetical protein
MVGRCISLQPQAQRAMPPGDGRDIRIQGPHYRHTVSSHLLIFEPSLWSGEVLGSTPMPLFFFNFEFIFYGRIKIPIH